MALITLHYDLLADTEFMGLVIDAGYRLTNRRNNDPRKLAVFNISGPEIDDDYAQFYVLMIEQNTKQIVVEKAPIWLVGF